MKIELNKIEYELVEFKKRFNHQQRNVVLSTLIQVIRKMNKLQDDDTPLITDWLDLKEWLNAEIDLLNKEQIGGVVK